MNSPKVSIVITTHNRPKLLERALTSALGQSYGNLEIHIVDDGSSQETRENIERIAIGQENIHYWRHSMRRGLAAARNTGIAKSQGEYIAFLDDDDEWKPDCVEKRMACLLNSKSPGSAKIGVVYCGCEIHIVDEKRTTLSLPRMEGDIVDNIRKRGLFTIPSSCIFPRTVLERIGGFDEKLSSSIDHDIWTNLAFHGYHSLAVHEALVVTYQEERRRMVTDTLPRVRGLEQYLAKWAPTFVKWFGPKEAQKYMRRYRTRVLGTLAGKKLTTGDFAEARALVWRVLTSNRWYKSESWLLSRLIGRGLVKRYVPVKVIAELKKRRW